MKESGKCRSGRAGLRTSWTGASTRGGKSAGALGDDERETCEGNGYVVVPPAEATALEMVEAKLTLAVFVDTLGSPALFDDTYRLLAREPMARLLGEPDDVMFGRCRFAAFPFHQ